MNTIVRTFVRTFYSSIVLLLLLSACATSTPRPPIAAEPTTVQTPGDVEGVPTTIDLVRRTLYQHSSGIFALDAPEGWRVEDNSSTNELRVRFREPSENAAIATTVLTMSQQLDSNALTQLLQAHLRDAYRTQPGFRLEPATVGTNNSVQIMWQCDSAAENGGAQLFGTSQITQRGNHVALLSVVVPQTQFANLAPQISAITNSYTLNASADTLITPLVPVEIGALRHYTYANNLFQLDVPVGWDERDQSAVGKASVAWSDQNTKSWLIVDVLQDDSQRSQDELGKLLVDVINEAFGEETGLVLAEPVVQEDNSVLLEWSYTATIKHGIAGRLHGRSFAHQDGDKVVIFAVATPADQNEQLQSQLNKIRASLIVDPSVILP